MSKTINRRELAKLVSKRTGYTITDVEEVLTAEDEVIATAISQGVSIKKHKLFKIDVETKPSKRAWNGFKKEYFYVEEKKVIKLRPLSDLTEAINQLNKTEYEEDKDLEGAPEQEN